MSRSALEQYAFHAKTVDAHQATMKELKKAAIKELNAIDGKIITIDGVKFHMTQKLKQTVYPAAIQTIINDLSTRLKEQKENAEKSGTVEFKYSKTFDAEILEPVLKKKKK